MRLGQSGFALLLPLITVALLVVLGGGGIAVYTFSKNHEVEEPILPQEQPDLQEDESEAVEPSPVASPEPTPYVGSTARSQSSSNRGSEDSTT